MSDTTIYKSIIQKEKSATEISDTTNNQSKQDTQKQEESKNGQKDYFHPIHSCSY